MRHPLLLQLAVMALLIGAGGPSLHASGSISPAPPAGASDQPAFRVRSAFDAPLNSDEGWAGALNENATIWADEPFRVRFEVEPAESAGRGGFGLQYRRNRGDWTDVEAHDFPHPERVLDLDFANARVGAPPEGWRVAQGHAAGLSVAKDGQAKVLRARADGEPLVGLYTPPWEATQLGAEFRLHAGSRNGVGFVFGDLASGSYGRVFLDPATGAIRVSRFVDGAEAIAVEKKAAIASGQWLEIEIQTEGEAVEVDYQDGTLELVADLGADVPPSPVGFLVPANGGVELREFTIEGEARTPRVSIVSCPAYEDGAPTTDLLTGSAAGFHPGAGMSLDDRTPAWTGAGSQGEFEWPLVVRRFADGAVTNDEGDAFELRMVGADGAPLGTSVIPVLPLSIRPGHVGGTFVETPGRIGPWRASNGDLYFIMEPTETDNLFLMIKSTDGGVTWREVDGQHRPPTNDLEAVDGRQVGDTIHILHEVSESARYHAFRTSDHPTHPDTWAIGGELVAEVEPVAQGAALAVRSDGSLVAFYVGPTRIHYNVRSAAGRWGEDAVLDGDIPPNLAGPQAVLGANDTVHLAHYGTDGSIWYRRMRPDGSFTTRQQLATGAGTTRAVYGAVLPLVSISETDTLVIIYRLASGALRERRVVKEGPPTAAVRVTDRDVVTDAVDSQQPAADAVADGRTVRVLFIEESSRSIFSTHDNGGWQAPTLRVEEILGSWVRGNVYTRNDGTRVYGFIYDAGSDGGAGMNRFAEIDLSGE
jgi:hypothetical protein